MCRVARIVIDGFRGLCCDYDDIRRFPSGMLRSGRAAPFLIDSVLKPGRLGMSVVADGQLLSESCMFSTSANRSKATSMSQRARAVI